LDALIFKIDELILLVNKTLLKLEIPETYIDELLETLLLNILYPLMYKLFIFKLEIAIILFNVTLLLKIANPEIFNVLLIEILFKIQELLILRFELIDIKPNNDKLEINKLELTVNELFKYELLDESFIILFNPTILIYFLLRFVSSVDFIYIYLDF